MLNLVGSLSGDGRKQELVKLGVSQTFEVGDCIECYTTGAANLASAALPFFGVITGFADSKGNPLPAPTLAAGTASGNDVLTVTTDETNSDGYYAFVDVSRDSIFSAEISGTLGTTNDSDLRGCRLDINSAGSEYGQLLETTATRTIGTPANFYSLGVDPNDSTRLLVTVSMSEREGVKE
jgi:hypothetical protein